MVDFSSLLPKTKSKTSSYYWSIVIEPSWVQAGIWSINQGESKVLTVGKPVSRDENEDLISVVDTALSSAVQNLDEDIDDPSAAVFGLSSQWILEGNIKGEAARDALQSKLETVQKLFPMKLSEAEPKKSGQ